MLTLTGKVSINENILINGGAIKREGKIEFQGR
jgi:hypothetical protein